MSDPRTHLCIHDLRNPEGCACNEVDITCQGRTEDCACDNCFHGRDELARSLLNAEERLQRAADALGAAGDITRPCRTCGFSIMALRLGMEKRLGLERRA